MSRREREPGRTARERVVLLRGEGDLLVATEVTALTEEIEAGRVGPGLLLLLHCH